MLRDVDLQVLVEPHNSLAEGLLLGEPEVRVTQVSTDGETVRDTAVKVDLPRLAGLGKGVLGLVTELGGEDLVDFYRHELEIACTCDWTRETYRKQQWTEGQ